MPGKFNKFFNSINSSLDNSPLTKKQNFNHHTLNIFPSKKLSHNYLKIKNNVRTFAVPKCGIKLLDKKARNAYYSAIS
jgi:hypothetical protein